MEKLRTFWFLSVLCLTGLNSALTQEENSYFVVGGTLNLRPRVSEAITNIVWKHKVDMVAEWVEGKLDEVYIPFKGRAFMDKTTGSLEIKNMTEADVGLYSVEINKKVQGQRYKAVAIVKVPKPSAVVRPLTCSHGSGSCTLSCEGETEGAEPVTYSWKMDDGEWEQSGKERVITEADDAHVEKFYCRIKNPVSEEQSEAEKNPFFKEKEPSNNGTIIGVSVFLILIAVGIAAVGFWKRDSINCNRAVDPEVGRDAVSESLLPKKNEETTEGQKNSSTGNGAPDGLTGTDANTDTAVKRAAGDTHAGGESGGDPPTQPTATPAGDHTSAAADDTHASPSGPAGGESGGDQPTEPPATPAGDHTSAAADDTHASPSEPAGGESGGDQPTEPTATPAGDHTSAAADDTHASPSGPAGGESGGDPPTEPTATPAGDHTSADEAQSSL